MVAEAIKRGAISPDRFTDTPEAAARMVANLAATDPALLRRPVPLAEVPVSIVPYRGNRRALTA